MSSGCYVVTFSCKGWGRNGMGGGGSINEYRLGSYMAACNYIAT